MKTFTLFGADQIESQTNTFYPNRYEITDADSLKQAVSKDYVCAEYRNNRRSNNNFIWSNVIPVDCDNTHSENPADWKTPQDVAAHFKDVAFAVHYSRNHNKEKKGQAPRPKFHLLFPVSTVNNRYEYSQLKQRLLKEFPYMDTGSIDDGHFFFGTADPQVEIFDGSMLLDDFFFDLDMKFPEVDIPQGQRNTKMLSAANAILKRYGNTDEAKLRFDEKSNDCKPPLSTDELKKIWTNAQAYYENVISKSDGYIKPGLYNQLGNYKPVDYSDTDQAIVLNETFGDRIAYSKASGFMVYEKPVWREEEALAKLLATKLTDLQRLDAELRLGNAIDAMESTGAQRLIDSTSKSTAQKGMSEDQQDAYKMLRDAMEYRKYVVRQRDSGEITGTLKALEPLVLTDFSKFDNQPFLLNTPDATYDLRKGLDGVKEPEASDFITLQTAVSPGEEGKEMWLDCLDTTFCHDQDLIEYVQQICGMALIGKVYDESLIIAYGDGANGKSTFWNTVARVLGTYSGNVSAEVLTTSAKNNVKNELAELRGKRLAIAAEMGSSRRLNDSTVKQLCSTDPIFAEKKYKDPFKYIPQHTLVLYTNNLPRVAETDHGIWRRLQVIPFNAHIEPSQDKKNYGDDLFNEAGPAILSWIIEGSQKAIKENFNLKKPTCVTEATEAYRDQNDWMAHFLEDYCELDPSYQEGSQKLIEAYRSFHERSGEGPDYTPNFTKELQKRFRKKEIKRKRHYIGLRIKDQEEESSTAFSDFDTEEDYGF